MALSAEWPNEQRGGETFCSRRKPTDRIADRRVRLIPVVSTRNQLDDHAGDLVERNDVVDYIVAPDRGSGHAGVPGGCSRTMIAVGKRGGSPSRTVRAASIPPAEPTIATIVDSARSEAKPSDHLPWFQPGCSKPICEIPRLVVGFHGSTHQRRRSWSSDLRFVPGRNQVL